MQKFEELERYIGEVWKTQGALAKKLKVSKNTVSQWVTRKLRVSLEYQKALAALKPPFLGPYTEPTEHISRAELDAAEKRIEILIHWHHQEMQKSLQALGAAQASALVELAELKEKLKG